MKKAGFFLILSMMFSVPAMAIEDSITSRFKFWLLNNEARMLSTISFDRQITAQIEEPFAIMPESPAAVNLSVERILSVHRKFYLFLDEIEQVYQLAARFGNGRFAIVIKQARPEIWAQVPLMIVHGPSKSLTGPYRKVFYDTLIKTLGLDSQRDKDLSSRLNKAKGRLSDEEMRVFKGYAEAFNALFPGDRSARMMLAFVENASTRQFAGGISRLLEPEIVSTSFVAVPVQAAPSDAGLDDPLAELEKLTAMTEAEEKQLGLDAKPVETTVEETIADSQPEETETSVGEEPEATTTTDETYETGETAPAGNNSGNENAGQEEPEGNQPDMFNIWD
ncbi:MAG: hypothetical protein ACOYXC_21105 [Candidatus Rifleibacteriota bacterium]